MSGDQVTYRELVATIEASSAKLEKKIDDLSETYVSKDRFNDRIKPIEKIVYSLAGTALLFVLGFVLNQVFGIKQ